jgi:hypothetical protein
MKSSRRKVTIFELLKIIVKRVRISTLILLLISFTSTTFAWFVYATKINVGLTAHIETWDVKFTADDNNITEYVNFVIPDLYPGMTDYEDGITAYNFGEKQATISYEIISAKVLGTVYTVDGTTLTTDQLSNILATDFPFKIELELTNDTISPNTGTTRFNIDVTWPYESGDDESDTYWGKKSYEFTNNNPTLPSIEISLKISAIQTQ